MWSSPDRYDYIFKILLTGDSNVGKSNLLSRFIRNQFTEEPNYRSGLDFECRTVPIENNKVKAVIWDTFGQERFCRITSSFYKCTHGVMIVYDITNRSTYENVKDWLNLALTHSTRRAVVVLVGNKRDLADQRVVSTEEASLFARENQIEFTETSALTSENIDDLFIDTLTEIKLLMLTYFDERPSGLWSHTFSYNAILSRARFDPTYVRDNPEIVRSPLAVMRPFIHSFMRLLITLLVFVIASLYFSYFKVSSGSSTVLKDYLIVFIVTFSTYFCYNLVF